MICKASLHATGLVLFSANQFRVINVIKYQGNEKIPVRWLIEWVHNVFVNKNISYETISGLSDLIATGDFTVPEIAKYLLLYNKMFFCIIWPIELSTHQCSCCSMTVCWDQAGSSEGLVQYGSGRDPSVLEESVLQQSWIHPGTSSGGLYMPWICPPEPWSVERTRVSGYLDVPYTEPHGSVPWLCGQINVQYKNKIVIKGIYL